MSLMQLEGSVDAAEMEQHAQVLVKNQEYKLARNIYRTLLTSGQNPSRALIGLGQTFELQKDWAKAKKMYEEAIAYKPTLDAFEGSARACSKVYEFTDAVDRIERGLALKDVGVEDKFRLLQAGSTYALDAQWMDRAEAWTKEALRIKPANEDLYIQLGTIAMRTTRLSMARKAYELALVVHAKSDRAWTGLGGVALKEKNTAQAYDCFLRALQIEIKNPPALFYLVRCAYELKRYAEAESRVRQYCDVAPVNPNLLYSLAGLQFHLGKFVETRKTLDLVLNLRPQHAGALELKTLCERYSANGT